MSNDGSNPPDSAADLFQEGLRAWAAAWNRMARDATGFVPLSDGRHSYEPKAVAGA